MHTIHCCQVGSLASFDSHSHAAWYPALSVVEVKATADLRSAVCWSTDRSNWSNKLIAKSKSPSATSRLLRNLKTFCWELHVVRGTNASARSCEGRRTRGMSGVRRSQVRRRRLGPAHALELWKDSNLRVDLKKEAGFPVPDGLTDFCVDVIKVCREPHNHQRSHAGATASGAGVQMTLKGNWSSWSSHSWCGEVWRSDAVSVFGPYG